MTVDFSKLKGKMAECGYTSGKMADEIGISRTSFSLKFNGKREFTLSEIINICRVLNITDANPYFFDSVLKIS